MNEASESLTRLVGQHNSMLWMGEYSEHVGAIMNRIGVHYLFSYSEYSGSDFAADMAKMAADATTQRW